MGKHRRAFAYRKWHLIVGFLRIANTGDECQLPGPECCQDRLRVPAPCCL